MEVLATWPCCAQWLHEKWLSSYLSSKVKVKVSQLCLTLCDPMDCNLPGSSVHGILQTRMLE